MNKNKILQKNGFYETFPVSPMVSDFHLLSQLNTLSVSVLLLIRCILISRHI